VKGGRPESLEAGRLGGWKAEEGIRRKDKSSKLLDARLKDKDQR